MNRSPAPADPERLVCNGAASRLSVVLSGPSSVHQAEDFPLGRLRGPQALGASLLGLVRHGARRSEGHQIRGAAALPPLPHAPEAQAVQLLPGAPPPAARGGGAADPRLPGAGEEDDGGGEAGEERARRAPRLQQEEIKQEEEKFIRQD